jgi:peptide/nickel transport system substrate-binding protein
MIDGANRMAQRPVVLGLALTMVVLAACAPPAAREAASLPAPAPSNGAVTPAAKKVMSMGVLREPPALAWGLLGNPLSAETGVANLPHLVHNGLAVEQEIGLYQAQLATALPSVEDGSWRVHSDGTMDTVWRLHPNIKWHDGTPFTSADLLFTYQVYTDPGFPNRGEARPLMSGVSAPDPLTFVIHWKEPYVAANSEPPGDEVLPRHLLEELYQTGDRNLFVNSPWFRTEFVGLGPYRVVHWEPGSHLELARFDDYYRGRPSFDAITVRFIADPNAMVANVLAGTLDVALPPGAGLEAAMEVQRRWEGTGNQVVAGPNGKVTILDPQVRPDYAAPRNGFPSILVRQAFYHALDRPALTDVMTNGLSPVADSYFAPQDSLRPAVESFIPQFSYDVAQAQRLLAQAGWVRAPDGALLHQASGERFQTEIRTSPGGGKERFVSVIADGWKALGAETSLYLVPVAQAGDRESNATRPGFNVTNPSARAFIDRNRLHSNQIATAANRWAGINAGGYANPRVDALLDRLRATIDPRDRLPLHQQLVREQIGDLAVLPVYWEVFTVLMVKGIRGPKLVNNAATQNIFDWDREL